jgi:hypothetical protein
MQPSSHLATQQQPTATEQRIIELTPTQRWVLIALATSDRGLSLEALVASFIDSGRDKKSAAPNITAALQRLQSYELAGRRLAVGRPGVFVWSAAPSARAAILKAPHVSP